MEVVKSIADKRLGELQAQIQDLTRRSEEQQATLVHIRQKLQQTREDDLNREVVALSKGTDKPKPKAPTVERALENAEHDAQVLARALEMASGEISRYYAENARHLAAKLRDAEAAKAQEVSELAAPLLASVREFYRVDEDAKVLKPYLQAPSESAEKPTNMLTIIGVPQTTANAYGADRIAGMERGVLENVIRSLTDLKAQYEVTSEGKGAA